MKQVSACILAAGLSTRMGQSKQLLEWQGRSMLEHLIRQLLRHEFDHVYAVIGHEAQQIQMRITIEDSRFSWLVNEAYPTGQSSSVACALDHGLQSHRAAAIFLGDLPLLKDETIRYIGIEGKRLLTTITEPFAVQPSYRGTPGHPVYLGNLQKESYAGLQGDQGMKPILRSMEHRYVLPVEDEGILLDIDTPAAYEHLKQRFAI
ncbi:MAG TPA: nucleotidyltransferase family protein [Candidatus Bathyarchaeia archaeon]|nr:nucleotidyltransferase family protein [Candidatus Bathyarchaeia archaeon]